MKGAPFEVESTWCGEESSAADECFCNIFFGETKEMRSLCSEQENAP
jgi:hypothetical protein